MYNTILSSRSEVYGNAIRPTCGPDNPKNWKSKDRYIINFDYRYNEHGFRCDSFNVKSEFPILFLGCSMTSGDGLPVEDTWAYKIYQKIQTKKNINIPFWSLAVSGSSIDLQSLYLLSAIDLIKPKFIFFLLPPIARRYFYLNTKSVMYNPIIKYMFSPDTLTETEYYTIQKAQGLLADEDYMMFESLKSLMAIDSICERYQTKILYTYWEDISSSHTDFFDTVNSLKNFTQMAAILKKNDLARDGVHFGPKSHNEFANCIWPQIETLI
jgi:hypothetical protein